MGEEHIQYNKEIRNAQLSILPPIEQQTLQQLARQRKINFNMMLSLPFLLKDPALQNRKDTIAIFRRKKFEAIKPQKLKLQLINNGRMYFNEFWSEKYQGSVLKESHMQSQLEQYRQIIKSNIKDYLDKYEDQMKENFNQIRNTDFKIKKQSSVSEYDDDDHHPNVIPPLNIRSCTNDELFDFYKGSSSKNIMSRPIETISNDEISIPELKISFNLKHKVKLERQKFNDKMSNLIKSCDRTKQLDQISFKSKRNKIKHKTQILMSEQIILNKK